MRPQSCATAVGHRITKRASRSAKGGGSCRASPSCTTMLVALLVGAGCKYVSEHVATDRRQAAGHRPGMAY
jgi:hypothetical protein